MADTTFLRFLPYLLLLLLPPALREYLPTTSDRRRVEDELHPIVLVPGVSCNDLDVRLTDAYRPSVPRCGAMKGKGWFGLWHNVTDLAAHDYVPCFMQQMSLVYRPDVNDYRNVPGVETRVRSFGSSKGFHWNPTRPAVCLHGLQPELERIGYRDGDTMFGAPYDFRQAPPIPGQPSRAYSLYFRQLMALVEKASRSKQRKVILFGHSFGGMVALEFLRATPLAWRDQYIKHLVLAAPLPAAGLMETVMYFLAGAGFLYVPTTTATSLRPMWRTFGSAIANFPSPAVFGDAPLVVTRRRNYSAHELDDLLADAGAGAAVEPFRRREAPRMGCFQPPVVPVTCIHGVGVKTPERLVYWDGDFDAAPDEVVYGDGDQSINLISMLAFDREMRRDPRQRKQFKSIKLPGAKHSTVVTDDWAVNRVVQEILEANRI